MKNKNLSFLKAGLVLFSLLSYSFQSYAQSATGPIIEMTQIINICHGGNWQQNPLPESPCELGSIWGNETNKDNETAIYIAAYASNLESLSENLEFPAAYPERPLLRYEKSPGIFNYIDMSIGWEQVDVQGLPLGQTIYRFQKLVQVTVPQRACGAYNEKVNFSMDLRIVYWDIRSLSYKDYPIPKYGTKDDVFSCEVFDPTYHVCTGDIKDQIDLITEVIICADCPGDHREPIVGRQVQEKSTEILAIPNPFSEQFEYYYNSDIEGEIQVQMHSSTGKLISTNKQKVAKGENRFYIRGIDMPSGIYFLSINDGNSRSVKKVIKR